MRPTIELNGDYSTDASRRDSLSPSYIAHGTDQRLFGLMVHAHGIMVISFTATGACLPLYTLTGVNCGIVADYTIATTDPRSYMSMGVKCVIGMGCSSAGPSLQDA